MHAAQHPGGEATELEALTWFLARLRTWHGKLAKSLRLRSPLVDKAGRNVASGVSLHGPLVPIFDARRKFTEHLRKGSRPIAALSLAE